MSYGDRLQAAMEAAKVDRKALAAELDISVQAVGQVILGDTKAFDAVNHTKAFRFLRCDPLWLAIGTRPFSVVHVAAHEASAKPYQWPFEVLDYGQVAMLKPDELLRLEGAWLQTASTLGFALGKPAAA